MNSDKLLKKMRCYDPIPARESHVDATVQSALDAHYDQQKLFSLNRLEFLWSQFTMTRKRWWILQSLLLLVTQKILPNMDTKYMQIRSLGVIGCLFVVMIIPELWRNQGNNSLQIEASCLYSLRQIYAARVTLFGVVDTVLLTLFYLLLRQFGFLPLEVVGHFLLPVTVTACICFWMLCGKQNWGEAASLTVSLTWSAVWWLIVMNEQVYTLILPTVWAGLLGIFLLLLALVLRKYINSSNQYWEVECCEITIG